MHVPKVSVVMPVYNAEKYLAGTVESILGQTLQDIELIVIDDASSDGSPEVLAGFRDPRIRVMRNERNLGVAGTMNLVLGHCRGEYVARMDADDLAHPRRLELQSEFLDRHPEIGAVGTEIVRVDPDGRPLPYQPRNPHTWGAVKWHMLINCCVAQPTVMARKEFFASAGGYEDVCGEDFHLWLAAIRKGNRICNLPQALLDYRIHASSISNVQYQKQLTSAAEAIVRHARYQLGFSLSPDLARESLRLADNEIPASSLARLVPFYLRIVWGCLWDKETTLSDFLIIARRAAGRLSKGAWRSVRLSSMSHQASERGDHG